MAKYYNKPMVSWGATALDLTEVDRLPTLSRVIGSAYRYRNLTYSMPTDHVPSIVWF